jgi:hypothetical protein
MLSNTIGCLFILIYRRNCEIPIVQSCPIPSILLLENYSLGNKTSNLLKKGQYDLKSANLPPKAIWNNF